MRKLAFAAILLALAFAASPAVAKRQMSPSATQHDSSWLSKEANMTSNIGHAVSDVPLGAVIGYPYYGTPSQYEGFRAAIGPDYVECDGSAIPADSDLCKQMGVCGSTPRLNVGQGASGMGYFLRAGSTPGLTSPDKFESHLHDMAHTHYFEGHLVSDALTAYLDQDKVSGKIDDTKVEGTALGQTFKDRVRSGDPRTVVQTASAWGPDVGYSQSRISIWTISNSSSTSTNFNYYNSKTDDSKLADAKVVNDAVTSKVVNTRSSGHLENSKVTGTTHQPDNANTAETGEDETAPTFFTVRYFMRVNN